MEKNTISTPTINIIIRNVHSSDAFKMTQITQDIKYVYLFSFVRWFGVCVCARSGFLRCLKRCRECIHICKREEIWWSVGMVSKINAQTTKSRDQEQHKHSISSQHSVKYFSFFSFFWYGPSHLLNSAEQSSQYWTQPRLMMHILLLIHVCIFYNCQWWSTLSRPTHSHIHSLFTTSPATNQPIIVLNSYAAQET